MILNVRLYDTLRRELKVSDKAAKEIIVGMEEVAEEAQKKCAHRIEFLTKDFQELKKYLDMRFDAIHSNFATKANLEKTKSEILRWMFIFWTSQITATIAFILLYLKK